MSKFTDNLKNLFANPDDTYDDIEEDEEDEEEAQEETVTRPAPARSTASAPTAPARASGVGSNANLEMRIMKPNNFESVTSIADQLLEGRTVVLNMEDVNQELLRHVIDFCTGVVYAIHGNLKRAGNTTYILTPRNVGISGEMAAEATTKSPKEIF